jgi:hypothetical protein
MIFLLKIPFASIKAGSCKVHQPIVRIWKMTIERFNTQKESRAINLSHPQSTHGDFCGRAENFSAMCHLFHLSSLSLSLAADTFLHRSERAREERAREPNPPRVRGKIVFLFKFV